MSQLIRWLPTIDLALVGVAVVWGFNFLAVRSTALELGPTTFAALRFTVGALVLGIVSVVISGPRLIPAADVPRLIAVTVAGPILFQLLFVWGVSLTSTTNASLITATVPVVIAAECHFFGRDRLNIKGWLGVTLTILGVGLTLLTHAAVFNEDLLGNLILVGATLAWGTYTFLLRPLLERSPPLIIMGMTVSLGAGTLLLLALPDIIGKDWRSVSTIGWTGLFY